MVDLTAEQATVIAAVLAAIVALVSVWQTRRYNRHTAWWTRAEWAIDKSLASEPEVREVGSFAMAVLAADRHATDADLKVIRAALQRVLDRP